MRFGPIVPLLISISAMASTYTVTAPHLTMHVGDPIPPLVFTISPYSGSYTNTFIGEPTRNTSATSSSPAGDYKIIISQGSLKTVSHADDLRFENGVLTILPSNPIGARLNNNVTYPLGFLSGPVGYAAIDVTRNSIANLVPDCQTDNAAAFNLLLSQNGKRAKSTTNGGANPLFLYFPPGCYATSQPLTLYGNTWSLLGSGPQRSYIRLLPNSPVFNTGKETQFFSPQSVTGNSNFREFVYDIGFNIGVGNPDAIPFTTEQNNSGAVRNVQIWADDSRCPYAISFRRAYPGPMLLKNVAVYGCKTAYSSNQNEYNVVFENFTTEAQTVTALDNGAIKASIRHWLSDNTVQALHVYGNGSANAVVLDSDLRNGSPQTAGISVEKGSTVYLKNITASGYNPTENDAGAETPVARTGNIKQAWTGAGKTLLNTEEVADSLHLPVKETPLANDPAAARWTQLGPNVAEWPAQIQGSASTTVYAPPGLYAASGITQVSVPDSVNHLQFYQSKFYTGSPKLSLTVSGSSKTPLIIEGCPYGSCQIVHTGSRPLVLSDEILDGYVSGDHAGDLFIEDAILGGGATHSDAVRFYPSQHIWARQLNMEQKTTDKFDCSGCTMWLLGYKTEQATPSIVLTDRAQAEVFGFFFYQNVAPGKDGSASIYLKDSSLFATGWTKVDTPHRGQPFWVIESQGQHSASLPTKSIDTSQQLNMFYSFGAGRPSGTSANKSKP